MDDANQVIRKLRVAAMIVAGNDHFVANGGFASDSFIDIWASGQETSDEVDSGASGEGCEVAGQEEAGLVFAG